MSSLIYSVGKYWRQSYVEAISVGAYTYVSVNIYTLKLYIIFYILS